MPDVFDQIELDKPKDLFDEVGEAWKAETVAPIPAPVPVPPMPAPVPDGQFPLRFIPPVPLSPEQATARRMAAPSTLLPSFPEKYGAGVAQGFPFVEEFGPKVQETDPAWLAASKALVNVGLSLPEFATSPLGALTQAAGPIAPRVTSAAFSIDMLGGALKQFPDVWENWNKLSTPRKIETGINLGAAILMGGFLGKKAVTGWGKQPLGRPSLTQRQAVEFTQELAEKDPETFGNLAREQVKKAVDVEQRERLRLTPPPVVPAKREEAAPVPPVPEPPIRDITAPTTAASEAMRAGVAERLEAGKVAPGTAAAEASARAQAAVEAGAARVEGAPAEPRSVWDILAEKGYSYDEIKDMLPATRERLAKAAPAPPAEKALTPSAESAIVPPVTEQPTFKVGDRVSYAEFVHKPDRKGRWSSTKRIETGTVIGLREGGKVAIVPDSVYTDPISARDPEHYAIRKNPTEPAHELKLIEQPAAPAAQPEGVVEHAIQEREAKALPVEVPPGDRGAVGAQVREQAAAKPEEAQEPRPPEAPVLLTPPAAEPERIVATAVRNPATGQIVSGRNKIHVQLYDKVGLDPVTMSSKDIAASSGYLTSKGRFVTQDEGQNLAVSARQIPPQQELIGEMVKDIAPPAAEAAKPAAAKEPWMTLESPTREDVMAGRYPAQLWASVHAPWLLRGIEYDGIISPLGKEQTRVHPKLIAEHKKLVKEALKAGQPVPPEVLADYPDLKPAAPSTKAGEAVPARTLKPDVRVRVLKAEELSAQALQKANELSEKGQKAKAEPFYQKSAQWLMRANELREDPKNYVEQPPPIPGAAAGGPISPGPGAAAAGTPGTGSAIRELADYIAALPPLKAPRKLSFAEKWAERLGRGKDLGTRVALRASAITESIKDSMRGVRRPTELGDSVAQLDFLLQRSAGESLRARTVLEKAIRNEDVRAALWLYADAKGDLAAIRDTLATMPADTKPAVRRALQIALRLPPEARNWLPFVEQFYGRKFAEAEAEGVLHEALPDYFTHVWKVKEDMPGSVQAALNSGKISEYFRYARERKLSTMLEGIKNPRMIPGMRLEPVLDAAKIVGHYNYALDRAIASRRFMERLSEMNASDGRPLVAPSGRAIPSEELKWAVINDTTGRADPFVKGIFDTPAEANAELARRGAGYHVEQRKNEFLMIKSRIRPEEIADYRPIDHPAMRKWQWAGTDATGKTTLYEGELLAHPEAFERLARFMDRSRLTPGKLTAGLLRYSGEVKAAKLGLLSTFHQVHVAKHALFHWTSPFRAPEIDWESPEVRFAIEKGHLKLAPEPGELNNFAEGILADEAIIHKLPIVGELSRRYSHYLFTDYIPRLKMATFANALERNRAIYGQTRGIGGAIKAFGAKPLSDAEIAARVGDSVNAAFGELNKLWLGKQGRDPRFQRALRMIFLAPDFGEARLRFVGKAFTKYGAEERFALAMNFATIYGLARIANWLATGDPHADDPKHWFDVKLGDHWYSMRSVMTDIAHLLAKPERFTRVRLNPGITEPLLEFISSRDWLGHTRTKGQQVEDYAKKFIPIAAQSLAEDDRHMWESFLGSMGIQPKRGDAVSEVHERAASYKERRGIQEPVEVQQAPSGNPYREGRIALEFNDPRRFWQAMQAQYAQLKARNNPDPMGTIQAAFDRYYSRPFMGSERLEKDFVAQMNPRDRKLYAEARQEQALSSKKFHAWWDKWHDYMLTGHRTGI